MGHCSVGDAGRDNEAINSTYARIKKTYATTLAGKSFRTLIAITARFRLQMLQFDVINAFVHAKLDRLIFIKMLSGHAQRNKILLLHRALYELRISLIL
jgi:hypothetical protein